MRLYIPRLGDKLILTENWYFKLLPDSRNEKIAAHFNNYLTSIKVNPAIFYHSEVWIDEGVKKLDPGRNPPVMISASFENREKMIWSQKMYDEWRVKFDVYQKAAREKHTKTIDVYITEGCTLTVDRIYIRKGAPEYDSVSFFVEGLVPKKIRFWAKLDDCNNIEFK